METHPDAGTIFNRVKKRIPQIALDTVYRNLKYLADQGLISIVGVYQDAQRFDANMQNHHHFICEKCGLIRDFYSDILSRVAPPKEAKQFGEPLSLHIEVKGICQTCRKKS